MKRGILPVLAGILVLCHVISFAQVGKPPRFPAIPHALYWENEPLKAVFEKASITITAGEKTDMFRDPNVT